MSALIDWRVPGHQPNGSDPLVEGAWIRARFGLMLCWELHTGNVIITLEPRPGYCDRGRWTAHVTVRPGLEHPHRLELDGHDMWPRMYFDLERAKRECEAWLVVRGERTATAED